MKTFLFALSLSCISVVSSGQVIKTATIKLPTVQCQECKERIENSVSKEDGIQKFVVDYKRKTAKVTYITDRINIETIRTDIANTGYDADDVTANPEAYQKLPTCCKKTEDGGGHAKKN
ncbi:MAG TPA: heavy-metal-associated domain-containing protein [Puia sp.]